MKLTRQHIGQLAEAQAAKYLQSQGLTLIARNFRTALGEIDLVMQERQTLVFVEVRKKKSQLYGGAIHSIDFKKQAKIRKTALIYLKRHKLVYKTVCRFDVVVFENDKLSWIRNAF